MTIADVVVLPPPHPGRYFDAYCWKVQVNGTIVASGDRRSMEVLARRWRQRIVEETAA